MNKPTPRTDNFKSQGREWLPLGIFEKVERELTAAREELKETKKHLKDANRGAEINAHALRINADKLITVTEQRDDLLRYNEAFRQDALICANCDAISVKEYKEAIEQRDKARSEAIKMSEKYNRAWEDRFQSSRVRDKFSWENNQPTEP